MNDSSLINSTGLSGAIVLAYVSNNPLPMSELPTLIDRIHATLCELMNGTVGIDSIETVGKATPAQIRTSIRPYALISFINGKPYRRLKRHLTCHGLDPRSYRERYGLPANYPMTAPGYTKRRFGIAKAITHGQLRTHR